MADTDIAQEFTFEEARRQLVARMREHLAKGHTRYAIAKKAKAPRSSIDRVLRGAHADITEQFDRISKALVDS